MKKKFQKRFEYPDLSTETGGIRLAEPVPGYLVAPLMGSLAATISLFPPADLADILEVSPKTITRWKKSGEALTPQQTDRIAHVEAILLQGEELFGSRERVMEWMQGKVLSLNCLRPIDVLKTETGRKRVANVLHGIAWGMAA
jgi:putative toxin-antitoxin system antitoxin component (TIGR02293 family)